MKLYVRPVINGNGQPAWSVFRRILWVFYIRVGGAYDYTTREGAELIKKHMEGK